VVLESGKFHGFSAQLARCFPWSSAWWHHSNAITHTSYERAAIEAVFQRTSPGRQDFQSPITGARLESDLLVRNFAMASIVSTVFPGYISGKLWYVSCACAFRVTALLIC
jgi:hypothetical protein